jgi:hypothetical protein
MPQIANISVARKPGNTARQPPAEGAAEQLDTSMDGQDGEAQVAWARATPPSWTGICFHP